MLSMAWLVLALVALSLVTTVGAPLPPHFWHILYRNYGYPMYQPIPGPVQLSPFTYREPQGSFNVPPQGPPFLTPLGPQPPQPGPGIGPYVTGLEQFAPALTNPQADQEPEHYKVVCYLEGWAATRPGLGTFTADDVNPFICTHLVYAFAVLDELDYTIRSSDHHLDVELGGYLNATQLKQRNPSLKVMLAIGGRKEGHLKFSYMSRHPHLRGKFVNSVVSFLQLHHFDGLSLDWAYPAPSPEDSRCEDKENIVRLIKDLRAALQQAGLLLSASVIPIKEIIDDGYDLAELSRDVDFLNVISYDLQMGRDQRVDHHSPLKRRPHDEWENVFRNVEYGVRYLLSKGAQASKLILGVPFFGRSFTLVDPHQHDIGSAAKGPGLPWNYTQEEGFVAYYELCSTLKDGTWTVERDEYGKAPFAYKGDQWIGYDDETSISAKMDFIKEMKLGGATVWAVDLDDYRGACGGQEWPLMRKVYFQLLGRAQDAEMLLPLPSVGGETPATSSLLANYWFRPQLPHLAPLFVSIKVPQVPIHQRQALPIKVYPHAGDVCRLNGFHRDPQDCSKFFNCYNGMLRRFFCPGGLHFNDLTSTCDWEQYAGCEDATVYDTGFECPSDGIHADPRDCTRYYMCSNREPVHLACPSGTAFQKTRSVCDWAANVKQCQFGLGGGDGSGGDGFGGGGGGGGGDGSWDGDEGHERPDLGGPETAPARPPPRPTEPTTPWARPTPKPTRPTAWPTWPTTSTWPTWQTSSTTPQPWTPRPTTQWTPRPTTQWSQKPTTTWPTWPTAPTRPFTQWGRPTTTQWTPRPTTPWATRPTTQWTPRPTTQWTPRPTTQWTEPTTTTLRTTTSRRPETTTWWWQEQTTTNKPLPTQKPFVMPAGMNDRFKVVCYFTNWAWYRPEPAKYFPEDVDLALCTHIIYAFTVLNSETLQIKLHDPWADIDNRFLERVVNLKTRNPKLKVILGLGGWTDSLGDKYSRLVNSPTARRQFIRTSVDFIKRHGFDGLDFDWEYPKCWQVDCKKGPDSDKQSFSAMISELRTEFDKSQPPLLLTAAVSPSKAVIDVGYDVASLARNLDFLNVMTYDYHGSWEKKTGHVAPLQYFPGDEFDYFNANFTLNYFLEKGTPREKIVVGMPMYGQSWTLANANDHGLNAQATGPGMAGEYSRQAGMLAYYEICSKINKEAWTVVKDPMGRIGPFAFKDNQWMSYDDVDTIRRKSQFIRDNNFGGGMIWALDFDDFNNVCCQERYPLLKTINRVLRNYPDTHHSSDACRYVDHPPPNDQPIETEVRRICITSRCDF